MRTRPRWLAMRRRFASLLLVTMLVSLVGPARVAQAATLTVTNLNDSGAGSLRGVIAAAAPGDTITFNLPTPGTITLTSGELLISKNLTISGPGASNLTISGGNASRVFNISGGIVTISGMRITGGSANPGAGIHNLGNLTLDASDISGNHATAAPGVERNGGGLYNAGGATTTINNSVVANNTADYGAGLYNFGTMTITGSTISGNAALGGGFGAGLQNWGTTTITNSTFSGNTSPTLGGGIQVSGGLTTLNDSTLIGNIAAQSGGGINIFAGTLNITGGTISNNTATDTGGGINVQTESANVTIMNAMIAGNAADGGGSINNTGITTITGTTISGNRAGPASGIVSGMFGGGIKNVDNGQVTITNSTISGNTAADDGAGIYNNDGNLGGTNLVRLNNVTVTANHAASDAGGIDNFGTVTFRNTLVAANTAGQTSPDCRNPFGHPFTSQGYNLIGDAAGCTITGTSTGNQLNINAQLGPIADNGGPTLTHAPLAGSPAIDVIPAAACAVANDQRGVSRPQGLACDIGAVEVSGFIDLHNRDWTTAYPLTLANTADPSINQATVDQHLLEQDQSAWFRFTVQPGARVAVSLANLPANYDLTLYGDIAESYRQLTSLSDLVQQSLQFAPDYIRPDYIRPDYIRPDYIRPDYIRPDYIRPDYIRPDYIRPDYIRPDYIRDESLSPEAYSNAQSRSLLSFSARDGTADELVIQNTWDNIGDFYVRVRGRDGVFSNLAPFRLTAQMFTGVCGSIAPVSTASTITPTTGGFKTIILADWSRMSGDLAAMQNRLQTFAARPEVKGVIVNAGGDARVQAANQQADNQAACPYAKNIVAGTIKELVDRYRALNPLEYVVIIGGDDVIPFFRHPEQVGLGHEKDYLPPVEPESSSDAALRNSYVLGQDRYGARFEATTLSRSLPIPDLAVGRLVETPAEIAGMLDAYLKTQGGVVNTPASALVTGYDFMTLDALLVREQLAKGTGQNVDALISNRDVPPSQVCQGAPDGNCAWTAEHLRARVLNRRYDLMYLGGHFSQGGTLAADYATRMSASEIARSPLDLENMIIFSAGCHSGYNTVNADALPWTETPDWPQSAAQKRITLIAGTGYQYGDTEISEYSTRLYTEFSRQLRAGAGPVALGKALVEAKHQYLATTPTMSGIHDKTLLQVVLYGLPMLSVNMPFERLATGIAPSIVGGTTSVATPCGSAGLTRADVNVTLSPQARTRSLTPTDGGSAITATWFSGSSGVTAQPDEPVLPLEIRNVSVAGQVARGVGFRGGTYQDLGGRVPLTGAPATELSSTRARFTSDVFFPYRPWSLNYFDALADPARGATRLMLTPAQFRSDSRGSLQGSWRTYTRMDMRLFYSANTGPVALGGAPAILDAQATASDGTLNFRVRAQGDPLADLQEVWVTYTATGGSLYGVWRSLDLARSAGDSTLWTGSLALNGADPQTIRFMVQAVNCSGLVTLDTNLGAYYTPGMPAPPTEPIPTLLTLQGPAAIDYADATDFTAVLLGAEGQPLAGKVIEFAVGTQRAFATTNSSGVAQVADLQVLQTPGTYTATAAFAAASGLRASADSRLVVVNELATSISLTQPAPSQFGEPTPVVATLTNERGQAVAERTITFVVAGPGDPYTSATITDFLGRAPLRLALAPGTYTITAAFDGAPDAIHESSTRQITLPLSDSHPPVIDFLPDRVAPATNAQGATVTFAPVVSDVPPVTVSCTPRSGSVFPIGATKVTCTATDSFNNTSQRSFTVRVAYRLSGFYAPVDASAPPRIIYNTVKGGSTVPVKFEIFAGATEITGVAAAEIKVDQVNCVAGAVEDAISETASGTTGLRYDGEQFIYNWQTPRQAGRCYRLTLTARDGLRTETGATFSGGSTLTAYFKLR